MITPEGDYLSNLKAPDLRPYFKHLHWRKMGHSMGHLVASDWADKADDDPVFGLYKNCGLWTRDEAAILWNCVNTKRNCWVDIGAHTGWTTAHILSAKAAFVEAIDPMLAVNAFNNRFGENLDPLFEVDGAHDSSLDVSAMTSNRFFYQQTHHEEIGWELFGGAVIDGDHEPGAPLQDAQNAYKHLADTGVIMFHDGIGAPVREAVTWLMDQGMKARIYFSPHIVFCCWRGDFEPPKHEPDPRINWTPHMFQMKRDFDFGRLS